MRGPLFPPPPELVETIERWVAALPMVRPRTVSLVQPPSVVIYTDALGAGHCAAVLFGHSSTRYACVTHCPTWMIDPALGVSIFEFELSAVVLGAPGRTVCAKPANPHWMR